MGSQFRRTPLGHLGQLTGPEILLLAADNMSKHQSRTSEFLSLREHGCRSQPPIRPSVAPVHSTGSKRRQLDRLLTGSFQKHR